MSCMPREYATFSSSFSSPLSRLVLICNGLVYEYNGRILKCGHEVCAGELDHSIDDLDSALFIVPCNRLLGGYEPFGDRP